ncbi:MAG: FHA domain-containing protein [Bdellovibrionales bacterium]|nr:FHA domain-containing protein [Bdellovibrionales bacterium]
MNPIATLPRTGFKFMISVRSGPAAGATYQLLPPRVTIGRDPASNSVVVNDARVSRNAAIIEFQPDQITILDISGKGKLTVNGNHGERHSLKGGDIIRLGDSELIFVVEAMQLPAVQNGLAQFGDAAAGGNPQMGGSAAPRPAKSSRSSGKKQKSPATFYMIVALIFGALIYAGTSEQGPKKLDSALRSTSEIEKEMSETDARVAAVTKKRAFKTEEEKTRYDEAQKHYIQGFRDYQKGNYSRAIISFETAMGLDPENVLARRYYRLAQKQKDEAITNLLLEGRRYREKNMYSRCSAAIEKALVLMNNKDDLKYKEAEKIKQECDLLQEN